MVAAAATKVSMELDGLSQRLGQRLEAYGAEVRAAPPDRLAPTVIGLIAERGWHRLVSVRRNRVGHPSVLGDDPPLSDDELDELDAVITESAMAVADLGAVILDHGPGQGRPSVTRIPKVHVCVVESTAVVATVAEAEARLDPDLPSTWISGPLAPDDLVTGLQRPRDLIVILVGV